MQETFSICGYTRISVDLEEDRDNTSIENQKAIIEDYVRECFPGSTLDLYVDRDRSGDGNLQENTAALLCHTRRKMGSQTTAKS